MKPKTWKGLISSKTTTLLDFELKAYIFGSFTSGDPCKTRGQEEMISDTFWKHRKALFYFFLLAACLFSKEIAAEETPSTLTTCDIQLGPCTKVKETLTVTLEIFPKPVKAMKELTFRLTLTGRELSDNPHIDLSMPGMDMGPNRVLMARVGNNTYEGQGVIVKCPSGRRTWKAKVTLPDAGVMDFVFDVLY